MPWQRQKLPRIERNEISGKGAKAMEKGTRATVQAEVEEVQGSPNVNWQEVVLEFWLRREAKMIVGKRMDLRYRFRPWQSHPRLWYLSRLNSGKSLFTMTIRYSQVGNMQPSLLIQCTVCAILHPLSTLAGTR
jgi:hypothetical protein